MCAYNKQDYIVNILYLHLLKINYKEFKINYTFISEIKKVLEVIILIK